jgi:hypothetical protein
MLIISNETGDFVNHAPNMLPKDSISIVAATKGPSGIYIGYFYIQRMAISVHLPFCEKRFIDIFADLANKQL